MPDIQKSHIWIPDLLKSHKCIPGAHLFPYYKSFSFTPVYHIKQHIHCSFLQVWDYDRNKDDDFLGRCHLDIRFLSTDHNTSFLIIPSRIPKKFYVPVTIAMEKRTADGSDWRGWKYFIVWSGGNWGYRTWFHTWKIWYRFFCGIWNLLSQLSKKMFKFIFRWKKARWK